MEQLGWGVIGIGRIVKTRMVPGIVAEPHCRIVAGVSRDQGRAEQFAREFGAPYAYTDYDEMLANPEVQAVFIATPNDQHADQVVAAAEAGKYVLCDKPLATSVEDALRAVDACERNGARLGINFHYRHMPWVREVKRLLDAGTIGDVRTVQIEVSAGSFGPEGWRDSAVEAGLGTTYSHAVHLFDALRWMLGADPVEVVSLFDDEGRYQVETQAMSLLRMGNGALAYVTSNQTNPHPLNDIVLYGTQGRIVGANLTRAHPGELRVLTDDGQTITEMVTPDAHRACIAAYSSAVLAGEIPNASGLDGLHSMILCDAMARSAREGHRITLDYGPIERFS